MFSAIARECAPGALGLALVLTQGCQAVLGLSDGDYALVDGGAEDASYTDTSSIHTAPPDARSAEDASATDASNGSNASDAPYASDASSATPDGDTADAGPPSLPIAQSAHLQLWVTADKGLVCDQGSPSRVTEWSDLSGHLRHAAPKGFLGPQCAMHTLAGIDVPYFSAPAPAKAGVYIDETLDVDLSFMGESEWTAFIVERRWGDYHGSNTASFFLGTQTANELSSPQFGALQMGYVYYDDFPSFDVDFTYYGTRTGNFIGDSPSPPVAVLDMARSTFAGGIELWINGVERGSRGRGVSLVKTLGQGSIGRAFKVGVEARYKGDIAEVIIYDTGLPMADQQQIERYLRYHWNQTFTPPPDVSLDSGAR